MERDGNRLATNVTDPSLTVYLPDSANSTGAAIIVALGGALQALSIDREGTKVAEWRNRKGIAAFVLKYRLRQQQASASRTGTPPPGPHEELKILNGNANPAPGDAVPDEVLRMGIADAQQALRLARKNAAEWHVDPKRVGLMGFSAGGVSVGAVPAGAPGASADFLISVYGPSLQEVKVPDDAPPLFMAVGSNHFNVTDGCLALFAEWKKAANRLKFTFTKGWAAASRCQEGGYIVVGPMGYNTQGWYGSPVIVMRGGSGRGRGPGAGAPAGPIGGDPGARAGRGPQTPDPPNLAELSEKDVMNVLGIVRAEFNVDDKRTYLMGHSMGGAGALFLGPKYVDQWAAVASMAPAAFLMKPESLAPVKDKMPLFLAHGDADTVVPTDVGRRWAKEATELQMKNFIYLELPGADHGTVITRSMPDIFKFFSEHTR